MAIRWDKLTLKAQEAVQRAGELASENGNPEVLSLHILAALLEDREGIVPPILEKIGAAANSILAEAKNGISQLPKVSGSSQQPQLSSTASAILERAFKEADQFKDEYVSTEHLLLAIAEGTKKAGDAAGQILAANGATRDA